MYTERNGKQNRLEMVILEDPVPQNHLLRKIDKAIDFSFINKICKPCYCENNGRPAVEPKDLFRMLFIGYLYGIRSERA
jgi:transposase